MIYSGRLSEGVYLPESGSVQALLGGQAQPPRASTTEERVAFGQRVYKRDGPITVNGNTFNSTMPSLRLSDEDVANVLTYIYSQWDNAGFVVLPQEVGAVREIP